MVQPYRCGGEHGRRVVIYGSTLHIIPFRGISSVEIRLPAAPKEIETNDGLRCSDGRSGDGSGRIGPNGSASRTIRIARHKCSPSIHWFPAIPVSPGYSRVPGGPSIPFALPIAHKPEAEQKHPRTGLEFLAFSVGGPLGPT